MNKIRNSFIKESKSAAHLLYYTQNLHNIRRVPGFVIRVNTSLTFNNFSDPSISALFIVSVSSEVAYNEQSMLTINNC